MLNGMLTLPVMLQCGVCEGERNSGDEIESTWMEWKENPFFRENLEVKESTVHYFQGGIQGGLVGQNGLFTKADIPSGGWVGFSPGTSLQRSSGKV